MYKELVETINSVVVEATEGDLTRNIAKFLKQQHNDLIRAGFSYAEAAQLLIAIAGKKS